MIVSAITGNCVDQFAPKKLRDLPFPGTQSHTQLLRFKVKFIDYISVICKAIQFFQEMTLS